MKKIAFYLQIILIFLYGSNVLVAQDMQEIDFSWDSEKLHTSESDLVCRIKHLENDPHKTGELSQIEPLLAAECEPLTTIAGCVNVCSGHFFQVDQDLVSQTIEPLSLIRTYDSGNNSESTLGYGFGLQFPLWASGIQKGARHHYGMISEREGFLLPYRDKENSHSKICSIDPRVLKQGYTNLSRATMSGYANFINRRASYQETQGSPQGKWIFQLGDGSKRIYSKYIKLKPEHQRRLDFPTREAYLLKQEIKPNGNQLLFSYQTSQGLPYLDKIQVVNRVNTILDELHFTYSSNSCVISNLYGDQVEYTFEHEPCVMFDVEKDHERKVLHQVVSSQEGDIVYKTKKEKTNRKIRRVEKDKKRFIEIEYQEATISKEQDRVKYILEPCGKDEEIIKTYQFHYQKNVTGVLDALHNLTLYHFDSYKRLSRIDYLESSKKLLRQEVFEWSKKEGEEGWLRAKSTQLGNQAFYLKTYRYDPRGNITRTTLYGNLTGDKSETFDPKNKRQMDHYVMEYSYSEDGRNLLMKKKTPEGLETIYQYLPNTNLCTTILQIYNGKIQERTFQAYDDNGQLVKIIKDDGSSEEESNLTDVTFRKIKVIDTYKTLHSASFGKPAQESELYQNLLTGELTLLTRKEFFYDGKGREIQQKIYHSHQFCYEINKCYNTRGQLTSESNPLGYVTHTKWRHHHKIREKVYQPTESGFKELKTTFFEYDLAGRLRKKKEKHSHGKEFVTSYSYNELNQLISEIDPYGYETHYTYDRFGNQKECMKPCLQNSQEDLIRPTIKKEFNALNQVIAETDENGFTTHYTYNIYGKPTQIIYPDQSIERFVYYPNGLLKQKWQVDEVSITYTYDPKGRLIKEAVFDKNGKLHKEETYFYKGPLLQSKRDALNVVTTYSYDDAGRKISETIQGLKTIHYEYDDFGRVIKMKKEGQWESYEYDHLNRVIAKTLQDAQGVLYAKETYQFNFQGKQENKTVWQSHHQTANYQSSYHSDGTLAWKKDPLEHCYSWKYNHQHFNERGQQVQEREITDPLGRISREIDDSFQRLATREVLDNGRTVSCTRFEYDAKGHCIKEYAMIMADGVFIREYWIERRYNSRGLLESETEKPADKTTIYHYDLAGRIQQKTKPDGITLNYTYDELGRRHTLTSSDGTIAYTYLYDLHDNLIQVNDNVNQRIQHRSFDQWNRLIKEEMSPGIFIHYTYDALDRITRMQLPDGSFIAYTYDAYHLKKIQRFNHLHAQVYEINSLSYDLRGNLLEIQTPAGKICYAYDPLGRAIHIQSPLWEAELDLFDPIGNLLKMKQRDPSGIQQYQLAYDRFNHLSNEWTNESIHYTYDSIGNCLQKNEQSYQINALNQIKNDVQADYSYDANGNLKAQSSPSIFYTYDALNRLASCDQDGNRTTFLYDAFGRCLEMTDYSGTKQLLYQGEQDIGGLINGQIQQFRLIHPNSCYDLTFAIEIEGQAFFPIQDFRGNICALQKTDGSLAQWTRYSAFGEKLVAEKTLEIINPWQFANRREIANLSLFAHRFYNPRLMRWQTPDPLGFEDGLNLYAYVHNNPFGYKDPDGQFAVAIQIFTWVFGSGVTAATLTEIGYALGIAGTFLALNNIDKLTDTDQTIDADTQNEEWQKPAQIEEKRPPYCGQKLGADPTKCPGEGFEWRGKGGPETGRGSWHNQNTNESLHPDFNHPPPVEPHWDYNSPKFPKGVRLNLDGTYELKI